jgi:hypothetical protein
MEIDPLSQLYNRGAFDGALKRYVDLARCRDNRSR